MRVALYVRVSTEEQAEEEVPIAAQIRECTDYLCQSYATTWGKTKGYQRGARTQLGSLYNGYLLSYNRGGCKRKLWRYWTEYCPPG